RPYPRADRFGSFARDILRNRFDDHPLDARRQLGANQTEESGRGHENELIVSLFDAPALELFGEGSRKILLKRTFGILPTECMSAYGDRCRTADFYRIESPWTIGELLADRDMPLGMPIVTDLDEGAGSCLHFKDARARSLSQEDPCSHLASFFIHV